jgi:hypothetical protein
MSNWDTLPPYLESRIVSEISTKAKIQAWKPKKLKYGNIKQEKHGKTWDSKKELSRYEELKLLEIAGEIANLSIQPRFEVCPSVTINGQRKMPPRYYFADFQYYDNKTDEWVIEDVKSEATRKDKTYRLKRQLFLSKNPTLKFIEV